MAELEARGQLEVFVRLFVSWGRLGARGGRGALDPDQNKEDFS